MHAEALGHVATAHEYVIATASGVREPTWLVMVRVRKWGQNHTLIFAQDFVTIVTEEHIVVEILLARC